ncbi:MAG: RNA methyltransferase [Acidobacteriota bacterium]
MDQTQQLISRTNNHLKLARQVRDGKDLSLIFIEGLRLADECLDCGLELAAAFCRSSPDSKLMSLLTRIRQTNCPIYEIDERLMKDISDTMTSQGLVLLGRRPVADLKQILTFALKQISQAPLIVMLDRIQDPGNAGAIVRTAEAAGAIGIVCTSGTVDPFAPKSLRASMGSAFRLPIATGVEVNSLLISEVRGRVRLVGTSSDAEQIYTDVDWRVPSLVVFGNEGAGIDPRLLAQCDVRVRIPLASPVESLNVASSAAVILFEAARQHRQLPARQPAGRNQRISKR